jgi:hypothetical protein
MPRTAIAPDLEESEEEYVSKEELDKFVRDLTPLMDQENHTLWSQADYLFDVPLSACEYIAVKFGRKPETIRQRKLAGAEYRNPSSRSARNSFGVHLKFIGVTDRIEREQLLKSRDWTVNSATVAVRNWKKGNQTAKSEIEGESESPNREKDDLGATLIKNAAMVVDLPQGRVRIRAEVTPSGKLKTTIYAAVGNIVSSKDDDEARTYYEVEEILGEEENGE